MWHAANERQSTSWPRWPVVVAALAALALFAGCGKLQKPGKSSPSSGSSTPATGSAGSVTPKPVPAKPDPAVPPPPTADQESAILAKVEAEKAKAPKFDRQAVIKQRLRERFKYDLDEYFPGGVYDPAQLPDKAAVDAAIKERLEAEVGRKYTPARYEELKRQAETEFPIFKVGDTVSLRVVKMPIKGVISKMDETRLIVLRDDKITQSVLIDDIIEPPKSCFRVAANEKERQAFLRRMFDVPRDDFRESRRKEISQIVLRESGCVPVEGRWVRVDELVKVRLLDEIDQEEKAYYERLTQDIRARVEQEVLAAPRE